MGLYGCKNGYFNKLHLPNVSRGILRPPQCRRPPSITGHKVGSVSTPGLPVWIRCRLDVVAVPTTVLNLPSSGQTDGAARVRTMVSASSSDSFTSAKIFASFPPFISQVSGKLPCDWTACDKVPSRLLFLHEDVMIRLIWKNGISPGGINEVYLLLIGALHDIQCRPG